MLVRGGFLSVFSDIATIDGENLSEENRLYKLSNFLLKRTNVYVHKYKGVFKKTYTSSLDYNFLLSISICEFC